MTSLTLTSEVGLVMYSRMGGLLTSVELFLLTEVGLVILSIMEGLLR